MLAKNRWHPSEKLLELLLMFNPDVVNLVEKLEGRKGKSSNRIGILHSVGKRKWKIHIFSAMIPVRYTRLLENVVWVDNAGRREG